MKLESTGKIPIAHLYEFHIRIENRINMKKSSEAYNSETEAVELNKQTPVNLELQKHRKKARKKEKLKENSKSTM